MDIGTHIISLELIILKLCLARREKKKFKDIDIEQTMKEYYEANRDLIQNIEFTQYDYEQQKFLLPYINKLINYLSEEELTLLNERLKTTKVKNGRINIINDILYGGMYDIKDNKLTYYHKSAIGHELIHLASSYYDEERDLAICGFSTHNYKKNLSFGYGLNEGYTELLASRIFNKKNKVTAYKGLAKICKMIELFFDDPTDMRKLFFSCNLTGVIEKLKEYMPEEEIYAVIFELDNGNIRTKTDSPTFRHLQAILYQRFMNKCQDENKRQEMEKLLSNNPIKKAMIKNLAKQVPEARVARNMQSVFKDRLKSIYKSAGAIALSYVSLIGLHQYQDRVTVPYNNATQFIHVINSQDNDVVDNIINLDATHYIHFNEKKAIDSYEGKYISKALQEQGIKCFQIGDQYYTPDGCDMQIDTYKAKYNKHIYLIGKPYIQNGFIVGYTYNIPDYIREEGNYTIEDGIVYTYQTKMLTKKTLPDGTVIDQDDFSESYDSIELVDTQTVKTIPYQALTEQQLMCHYKENYDEEEDIHYISDISYTLKLKKN